MIEVSVDSVRINLATQQRVVILKATGQDRYLFIWIAQPEAYAIAVYLQGTISPRPLSHDLMKDLIEATGTKVTRVVIADYNNEIYYAQVILDIAEEERAIDARPSDAIALAVRIKTPIFVAEQVLEQRGMQFPEQVDMQMYPNDNTFLSSANPKKEEQKQTIEDTDVDTEASE